jgi:hypothetical protein
MSFHREGSLARCGSPRARWMRVCVCVCVARRGELQTHVRCVTHDTPEREDQLDGYSACGNGRAGNNNNESRKEGRRRFACWRKSKLRFDEVRQYCSHNGKNVRLHSKLMTYIHLHLSCVPYCCGCHKYDKVGRIAGGGRTPLLIHDTRSKVCCIPFFTMKSRQTHTHTHTQRSAQPMVQLPHSLINVSLSLTS